MYARPNLRKHGIKATRLVRRCAAHVCARSCACGRYALRPLPYGVLCTHRPTLQPTRGRYAESCLPTCLVFPACACVPTRDPLGADQSPPPRMPHRANAAQEGVARVEPIHLQITTPQPSRSRLHSPSASRPASARSASGGACGETATVPVRKWRRAQVGS